MKLRLSILAALAMVLAMVMPVLADGPAYDVYTPGKGMTYQQPKPTLTDGQIFQFCVDGGGVNWRCTAASVRGNTWRNDPYATQGFTDEQHSAMWTIWSSKDDLGFIEPGPAYVTEIAPQPVVASLPDPKVQSCYDKGDLFRVCLDWLAVERTH